MRPYQDAEVRLRLDLGSGDAAHRIAAWRDAMAPSGAIEVCPADRDGFVAEAHWRFLGAVLATWVSAGTFRFLRDEATVRRIRHDHVLVNLVECGRFSGRSGGRGLEVGPGGVCVTRLASTMDVRVEASIWLALIVPLTALGRHMTWQRSFDGRVYAPGSQQAVLLGHHMRALLDLAAPLPPRDVGRVARASVGLLAACLGGPSPGAVPGRGTSGAPAGGDLAEVVRRLVAQRLRDPELDPALICSELGVSRSALYRAMGTDGDVVGAIRRLRLHGAHAEIVADDAAGRPLGEVGKRWGMPDARVFRRAFAREFGCSPSALRARMRAGGQPAREVFDAGAEIANWLHGP